MTVIIDVCAMVGIVSALAVLIIFIAGFALLLRAPSGPSTKV